MSLLNFFIFLANFFCNHSWQPKRNIRVCMDWNSIENNRRFSLKKRDNNNNDNNNNNNIKIEMSLENHTVVRLLCVYRFSELLEAVLADFLLNSRSIVYLRVFFIQYLFNIKTLCCR